jgi:hypothetical protein
VKCDICPKTAIYYVHGGVGFCREHKAFALVATKREDAKFKKRLELKRAKERSWRNTP